MGETTLSQRAYLSSSRASFLTPTQAGAESLISTFVERATDRYSLAAMVGGGLIYRLGRLGTLALGSRLFGVGAIHESPLLASHLLRLTSVGVGFGAEVFTFEAGQRVLRVGMGGADPALLNWSGENGLGRGLVGAAIALGSLKGTGVFVNGQNPVLQHLFQDSAMVFAHNVSGRMGITDRPRESFAEQFINAEATLWQMNAGMRLVHHLVPGLSAFERELDLSLRGMEVETAGFLRDRRIPLGLQPAVAGAPLFKPALTGEKKGRDIGGGITHFSTGSGGSGRSDRPNDWMIGSTEGNVGINLIFPSDPSGIKWGKGLPLLISFKLILRGGTTSPDFPKGALARKLAAEGRLKYLLCTLNIPQLDVYMSSDGTLLRVKVYDGKDLIHDFRESPPGKTTTFDPEESPEADPGPGRLPLLPDPPVEEPKWEITVKGKARNSDRMSPIRVIAEDTTEKRDTEPMQEGRDTDLDDPDPVTKPSRSDS